MLKEHAVIIGGSSGIGLATARRLIEQGLKVTILGRDPARLASARAELAEAEAVMVDATERQDVKQVLERLGSFRHLVLAFGSRAGLGPFAEIGMADVRKGFEEKVFPHFQCAQLALPLLEPGASITFVSAVSARAGAPGTAGIGAANAAIEALVPILAAELKPVRVNGVSPGVIDTPWWDFLPAEQKAALFKQYGGSTPVGRIGSPDDVARTIAFLIADGFVTGQTIVCDGGMSLTS